MLPRRLTEWTEGEKLRKWGASRCSGVLRICARGFDVVWFKDIRKGEREDSRECATVRWFWMKDNLHFETG